ncbi:MAG: helix-turn-helix domain-containing protein [Pseudonocardiaceae bacterium]
MDQPTFGGELRRLREERGLSLKKCAHLVHYDPGYLSKIENGLKPPTATLATACDGVLETDGHLARLVDRAGEGRRTQRSGSPPALHPCTLWEPDGVIDYALRLTGFDLALSRREALLGGRAMLAGEALVDPLRNWLLPSASRSGRELHGLSEDQVLAMEAGVRYLRTWARQRGGGMARGVVAAQLRDMCDRLQSVRSGVLRDRAFLAGAQLARLVASLAWDTGSYSDAQRYYVLAVQMAHVARDPGYAALALADLARQSLDLGVPQDDLASTEPRHAYFAEKYINQALSVRAADRIRNRTFDLIGLARTYLIGGEPEQACLIARQAVDINGEMLTGRPRRKLEDFSRELAPYNSTAAGRDFSEYLRHLSN